LNFPPELASGQVDSISPHGSHVVNRFAGYAGSQSHFKYDWFQISAGGIQEDILKIKEMSG
jgi:hypothetical protein